MKLSRGVRLVLVGYALQLLQVYGMWNMVH